MLEFKISDFDVWEWEGGRVYSDWEPSEIRIMLSFAETKYKLTCLLANASRHVRKYFFNRTEVATQPTTAQQVGEFVTEIRRLLRSSEFAEIAEFRILTDTDSWSSVAVPNSFNTYKWRFPFQTTDGAFHLDIALIQTICENALTMANTEKTSDEEFREINNSLNNLLKEQTALDTLIYKAKELNAQAGVVVDNLCGIAEKLQECS